MALKYSVALRNLRANQIEVAAGPDPILEFRSGAAPANVAAARTGTVLVTMTLPTDWAGDAVNGVKSMLGTWEDDAADADGVAGYWTLYQDDGVTAVAQGTITATGGDGDMKLTTTTIVAGQPVTITSWAITEGNA